MKIESNDSAPRHGIEAFDVVCDQPSPRMTVGSIVLGGNASPENVARVISRAERDALAADAFKASPVSNVTPFEPKKPAPDEAAFRAKVSDLIADLGREPNTIERAMIEELARVLLRQGELWREADQEELALNNSMLIDSLEAFADMTAPSASSMTLRDHFAGLAISRTVCRLDAKIAAGMAYDFADAMMAERAKRRAQANVSDDKVPA